MREAEKQLHRQIAQQTGSAVVGFRPFATGNNTALYLIDTKDGDRLVAKIARKPEARLDLEAWMLRYLAARSQLPVPRVIWAKPDALVMSYLPSGPGLCEGAEIHAASLLAGLHGITGQSYGLERDTLIGSLHQLNSPEQNWVVFFREHRLLYMARAACEEGRIDAGLMQKIERLAGKLEEYIDSSAPPSLLHGDIWGGNVLASNGRISGFIDPAIYYGDPEIELAFSTLFGTFGPAFFRRYQELRPLKAGFFELRKDIYNLYPLLVHVRLFGGPYVGRVDEIVNRLVA